MKLSIIVSLFNEESAVRAFFESLVEVLKDYVNYEIIFVNDGSTDNTLKIITEFTRKNKHVKSISFSRNFGHEAAMLAGIDHAKGEVLICMDGDLQHPPKMIPDMLKRYEKGDVDIINMVPTRIKSVSSKWFYKVINLISPVAVEANASDFFLISERVAKILQKSYRERVRFLRGYIQMMGFKKVSLSFELEDRQFGSSKYSFSKLFSLSLTAIATLSKFPLQLGIYVGFLSGLFGIILAVYSIIMKIIEQPVSGYTTIIVFLSLMFSALFFILGVIGVYIGFLFDEQKKRPIYIIESTNNIEHENEIIIG
jgi:dolichol-phosphate mannosyltransferase